MPLRIALRISPDHSPFRDMLRALILSPAGDTTVLCSGYIWQPNRGYNVLDDQLLDALTQGCGGKGHIITVAGKLEQHEWRNYYTNFVTKLRQSCLSVTAYEAPKRNWHAKIAMRLDQDLPVACIVGSSNLTGPAYGIGRRSWNFEGDVLIWNADPALTQYFSRFDSLTPGLGVFDLILNPETHQPDETKQMMAIYKDIFQQELLEPFEDH